VMPPQVALPIPQRWPGLITAVISAEVANGFWDR
jgi:hypothetical protein